MGSLVSFGQMMPIFEAPDYGVVEGTEAAYRGFFPEKRWAPAPAGAVDVPVAVADGVEIGCRFHPGQPDGANLLYFHGNGETVSDYDDIVPLFTRLGINLFVADYRGYGASTGSPSFPSMLSDSHLVFAEFDQFLEARGLGGRRYVMGRSMGGHSAVEVAAHHPDVLSGLILESSAPFVGRLLEYLEAVGEREKAAELERRHLGKITAIRIPVLALHGEWDELIPISRAEAFFEALTTDQKRMVRVPRAGHNDILWVGMEGYLEAVRGFVEAS